MSDFLKSIITGKVDNPTPSAKGELNKADLTKVASHALIVGLCAAITALVDSVGQLHLGESQVFIVPILSSLALTVQKWLTKVDPTVPADEVKK
jgi:hypothetical protein